MKVRSKPSSHGQSNGLGASHRDVPIPKTRFSLNDRSCSSPRLKSFPAERMKRLEPEAVSNPQENVDARHRIQNTGQGDDPTQPCGFQSRPLTQSFAPPNQNLSSMSEQQVPRTVCPIEQQANQSEPAIAIPFGVASNERPSHRPHVPRPNTTLRDRSPEKSVDPRLIRTSQSADQTQTPRVGEPGRLRQRDPWSIENDAIKTTSPEKDSAAAAISADFRHSSVPVGWNGNVNVPIRQTPIASPLVSNLCPEAEGRPTVWSHSQQIYQNHQPNMPCCHNNNVQEGGILRRPVIESNAGMTSPQDVAMNQRENRYRTMQRGLHSHDPWIQNNRAQTQFHPTNIEAPGNANPAPSACYHRVPQSEITIGPNPHQMLPVNGQTQQQHYPQQVHHASQARSAPTISSKTPGNDNQLKKRDDGKKILEFTPVMIKDQEMLVTTMRQQGIPDEIMRCQFDALLAEQRKQLLYLEQLDQVESAAPKTATQGRRVQRRISKIEEDGKPEWMLHITPPRIPYSVIEQMRSEREVERNFSESPQLHYDQLAQENAERTCENGRSNGDPPSLPSPHDCGNTNDVNGQQLYSATDSHGGQHQPRYCGYPMQQQLQQPNYPQQGPQKKLQDVVCNPDERNAEDHRNQHHKRSLEPSSLLKLRLYKEVIRQQKQNNGLQDPETIREAMEALKNPANRKGLEYLDDLNKKSERPFSLNGAQDPHVQCLATNGSPQTAPALRPSAKKPSANGLENQRNSNTPSASSMAHRKKIKEAQWSEYPRQKIKCTSRDCCSLIAENENGNPAKTVPKDNHDSFPVMEQNFAMQNPTTACPMHVQSRLENDGQFTGRSLENPVYNDGKHWAGVNPSMLENQYQYHADQMQRFYGNSSNCDRTHSTNAQACTNPCTGFPMEGPLHTGAGIPQQYSDVNNGIQEMIISGGLKYLARKSEYIPNSSLSHSYQNVNPSNYFNPTVPCQ